MNRGIDAVLFVDQPPSDLLSSGEVVGYQDFNDIAAGWASTKETRLFHDVLDYFSQSDTELKEIVTEIRYTPQGGIAACDRNPVSKQLYIKTQELFDLVEMLSLGKKVPGLGPKSLLMLKEVLGIDDPDIVPRIPADEYYKSLGRLIMGEIDSMLEDGSVTLHKTL